ncbi:hypothetical protein B0J17DRAFT_710796 [Rhizoctonia solani]|nr:hypothetical protein B0J17DRAFT_710796 [Rhizoctonia solani]
MAPQMIAHQAHVATAGVLSATFGIPGRSDIPSHKGSHKVVVVHVSPNDSFKTSLGVDSSLRVTYPSAKSLNRTAAQSGFSFLARERQPILAHSQCITIRNSGLTSVSDLRVEDHLPVGTDARLKEKRQGHVMDKCAERRESTMGTLGAGGEDTVEWSCEIGPSEEVELELVWEVWAPLGSHGKTCRHWYTYLRTLEYLNPRGATKYQTYNRCKINKELKPKDRDTWAITTENERRIITTAQSMIAPTKVDIATAEIGSRARCAPVV